MSNPKVFEYAKEIGLTTLALMDKIREWQLPVKSHMAELDPETLSVIKAKLSQPTGGKAEQEPKKAAPRKKAAATPVAKPVKAASTDKSAKSAPAPAAAKPAGGAVVRRKAKTEDVRPESIVPEKEVEPQVVEEAAPVVARVEMKTSPIEKNEKVEKREAPVEKIEKTVATEVPPAQTLSTTSPAAAVKVEDVGVEKKTAPRKKEVSIGRSGVESSQNVASAPKRNIIGRMDLSRVAQQAPQQRPQGGYRPGGAPGGGTGSPAGGGGGGFGGPRPNRSSGNLRAGFVQAPSVPEPFPDILDIEQTKKREDRRRNKGGGMSETAQVRPTEEEIKQVFDAAEFRKREMVFQPKKKKGLLNRPALQTQITKPDASKRVVHVYGTIKVSDLANEMKLKASDLIKALVKNGVMASMNTDLDFDTVALIVPEFGFEAIMSKKTAEDILLETAFGDVSSEPVTRPPVVTIMGHVDHGKTSLLDAIRNANVAAGEAGGITQHIGAYQVQIETGQLITFLDTPGHEAFTQMRARGANVTDIAVVVVAADDGVMPQTAEAISHAKAAGVPIIMAVNKMDKPGANPDRVKQQLTEYQVVPEEWGGDTIFCPVSALKKTGIKELLEQILLVAEVEDLKANPKRSGTGAVIESRLEKGRGNVVTILVHDGTVKVGQHIVAGAVSGKVRSLMTYRGEKVVEAGPGMPVEVLGLDGSPAAGDRFDIVKDERVAEEVVRARREAELKAANPSSKMSLEDLFSKVKSGDVKELPVVLKADVAGSLEAISGMFTKLTAAEVKVKVIHSAIGGVTENDVLLASTAKGIVVGFNVRPDMGAASAAKRLGVEVRTYSIVYELMDDMKKAMAGLLQPDVVERVLGKAEVRNTFNVPKLGTIAGCAVLDGKVQRNNLARLIRDGKIIYQGKLGSLKRFKDDAKEVAAGFECGLSIENFNDLKVGDIVELYVKEEITKQLNLTSESQPNAQ